VVLTQADLQEMKKRVEIAIASCGDLMSLHHTHEDAISELEKSIDGIKDLLAKAAQVGAQAQKSRADYIASGRMAE